MQPDEDEGSLRTFLADLPLPPAHLDLPQLIEHGQRRVRRRRVGQLGLTLLVAAAVAGTAAAPQLLRHSASANLPGGTAAASPTTAPVSAQPSPSAGASTDPLAGPVLRTCPASKLPIPAGLSDVEVTVVDPTGRYIGADAWKGQNSVPVLWTDGVPQVLPVHRTSVEVDSINASGVVVGLASGADNEDDVYRYQNGRVTFLKPPPGQWHLYPVPKINAAGDIVINAEPRHQAGGANSFAFYWPAGSDTAVKLPLPAGANVSDVNDEKLVAGGIYIDGAGTGGGYAWDLAGHGTQLAAPAGTSVLGYAIAGDWVAGGVWPLAKNNRVNDGGIWNLRTGQVVRLPNHVLTFVNANGWVPVTDKVWTPDGVLRLAVPDPGQTVTAVAASTTGLVVGGQRKLTADGQTEIPNTPVTWHC